LLHHLPEIFIRVKDGLRLSLRSPSRNLYGFSAPGLVAESPQGVAVGLHHVATCAGVFRYLARTQPRAVPSAFTGARACVRPDVGNRAMAGPNGCRYYSRCSHPSCSRDLWVAGCEVSQTALGAPALDDAALPQHEKHEEQSQSASMPRPTNGVRCVAAIGVTAWDAAKVEYAGLPEN